MLKSALALASVTLLQTAHAEVAFSCKTTQGSRLAMHFNESSPSYVNFEMGGRVGTRFVQEAGSSTSFFTDGEVRTYRFDFGAGGKNLVLNIGVDYWNPDDEHPTVVGKVDSKSFSCVSQTSVVHYTVLDRIINAR